MSKVFLPRIPPTHCSLEQSTANLSVQPERRLRVTVSGCQHITTVSLDVAITTSREEQRERESERERKAKKIKETKFWAIMRQESLIFGFDLLPRIQTGEVQTCFSESGAQTQSQSWNKYKIKASHLVLNSFSGW